MNRPSKVDTPYEQDASSHRLGQYRAWPINNNSLNNPTDMVWISIAQPIEPAIHRVLPHGEPSVAILRRRNSDLTIADVRLTICGPYNQTHWYQPQPREELIAVRIKPEWSAQAFGISPVEFSTQIPEPALAPKSLHVACSESIKSAEQDSSVHDVARLLINDLQSLFCKADLVCTPEAVAAEVLRSTSGRMRTSSIARDLDISERHLRRRFHDHLGYSPKFYARQLRLTSVVLDAERFDRPNWTQLALRWGYCDQAHMNKEFRSILNVTPQSLHRERRALSVFYNQWH